MSAHITAGRCSLSQPLGYWFEQLSHIITSRKRSHVATVPEFVCYNCIVSNYLLPFYVD